MKKNNEAKISYAKQIEIHNNKYILVFFSALENTIEVIIFKVLNLSKILIIKKITLIDRSIVRLLGFSKN